MSYLVTPDTGDEIISELMLHESLDGISDAAAFWMKKDSVERGKNDATYFE